MGFRVSTGCPSYVYQTPSGYVFRLRIPNDLRGVVGRTEFRYSLRSGSLRVAKHRARCMASLCHQMFTEVRTEMSKYTPEKIIEKVKQGVTDVIFDSSGIEAGSPGIYVEGNAVNMPSYNVPSNSDTLLHPEKIKQIVIRYIKETLENDERCRALPVGIPLITEGEELSFLEASSMGPEEAHSTLQMVTRWLRIGDHSLVHSLTAKLLEREGVSADAESQTFKVLSRELLVAFQSILDVRIKRSNGDYKQADEELIPELGSVKSSDIKATNVPVMMKQEKQSSHQVTLALLQARYLEEIETGDNWTEKTKAENLSIFAMFQRVMGDLPVYQIDRQLMSEYKSTLMKLPPNLNKNPDFKDKSIDEIIALKPKKTLSVNSINKHIRRLSGLFNYGVRNGFMSSNPAEGMQIKSNKRPDQEREAYSREDLIKLFHSKEYLDYDKTTYRYWAPIIALYTGCRLEEICQLHLDDIRKEDGVWVFDINDKEEKRVKTQSSKRLVPIHPYLLEIGLLANVESLKAKGEQRLFPELKQRRDGYGQTVSKWFQRFKQRQGIDGAKNFHSFRHTFITHLKHKGVDPFMIHELDGHAIDSETMGRYGKRYTPEILLREAIEKINYSL